MEAGALGPDEALRILDRHLADSLCFAGVLGTPLPSPVLDVGSGSGLPGIPIAIAFPPVRVTLLDRSEKRAALLRRAIRVLGVENAAVLEGDVAGVDRTYPALTFRASLSPEAAMRAVPRLLDPGGVAVLGLSRAQAPDQGPLRRVASEVGLDIATKPIPADILDSPAWLLRMTLQ